MVEPIARSPPPRAWRTPGAAQTRLACLGHRLCPLGAGVIPREPAAPARNSPGRGSPEAALALPASAWLAVADDGGFWGIGRCRLSPGGLPALTSPGRRRWSLRSWRARRLFSICCRAYPARLHGLALLRSQVAQSRVGACLDYQRYRYRSFLVGLAPLSGLRLHCGSDSLPSRPERSSTSIDARRRLGLADPTGRGLTLLVETLAAADLSRAPERRRSCGSLPMRPSS